MSEKKKDNKRRDNKGRILQTGEYYDEKNQRYVFRKMVDGRRENITAPDLVTLREEKNKLLCRLDKKQFTSSKSKMSLDEYFDFWYETYAKSGRKATTCGNYLSYYNTYIRGKLGTKQVIKVTKLDCQKIFNNMIIQGLKHSTLSNLKSCLNILFECAIDDEAALKNPVRNIQLPQTEKKERKAIEEEQVTLFMNYVKNNLKYSANYPVFTVLFNTGMRIGELCALTWEDFDFEKGIITINKNLNRYRKKEYGFTMGVASTKSKKSCRTIKMNSVVKTTLLKHKLQNITCVMELPYLDDTGIVRGKITDFVFLNSRRKVWCEPTFNQMIKRIIEEYNNENPDNPLDGFCPHEARHTYTSLAYNAGADVKAVSQVLGHASTQVTRDVYVHLTSEKQKEQDAVMERIQIS